MKRARNIVFAFTLSLTFIFSACASPTPETLIVVVTATGDASTVVPTTEPVVTMEPIALAGPQSGQTMKWLDNSTLVYIPAGDFEMGDNGFDAPIHSVSLDGYWIQQTKVTNLMYEQCVKTGACLRVIL